MSREMGGRANKCFGRSAQEFSLFRFQTASNGWIYLLGGLGPSLIVGHLTGD